MGPGVRRSKRPPLASGIRCNVLRKLRVLLDKIGFFATKNQKFVSAISIFANVRVTGYSCESAFKFLGRNGFVMGWKNRRTWCLWYGWNLKIEDVLIILLDFSVGVGPFVIGLSQISSFLFLFSLLNSLGSTSDWPHFSSRLFCSTSKDLA